MQFIRGGEPGQSQRHFEDEQWEQPDEDCSNSKRPFSTASVSHEEVCREQAMLGNRQIGDFNLLLRLYRAWQSVIAGIPQFRWKLSSLNIEGQTDILDNREADKVVLSRCINVSLSCIPTWRACFHGPSWTAT